MKKRIIILFIVIIGIIAIALGICNMQDDDKKKNSGEDIPINVEEVGDELIIVPQEQEESEKNDGKDSKNESATSNAKQSMPEEVGDDSKGEIIEPSIDQSTEQDTQEGSGMEMGENELPFVPAK